MKIEKDDKLTKSKDLLEENIQNLKQLFPEAFTEDKIDFEALKEVLGEYVEKDKERYSFSWAGKQQARREAQKVSTGTLRPCKEESVNFDDTENLYIEGDNLEVLKLLQKSYHNSIKMIYIDPPYNTGKDFVYKDNYHDNLKNYKQVTGQVDSDGNKLSTNSDSAGRYHSNWLNMMYPRLKLARNLLKDDGVIFISIDDNEVENLKKICNEIFGEENFVSNIIWQSRTSISNDQEVSINHNHTLIFSKNRVSLKFYGEPLNENEYSNPDNDERGKWKLVPIDANKPGGNTKYPILNPLTNVEYLPPNGRSWAINEEDFKKLLADNRIKFGMKGDSSPKKKLFLNERIMKGDTKTPSSIMLDAGTTKNGTTEIMNIFDKLKVFSYPKPSSFISRLINYSINPNENNIILDFFSGSGTLAHSVFQQKKKNISFILVQLPENLDNQLLTAKDDAKKSIETAIKFLDKINKPHVLTEIGKERIRRVINKIKEEQNGQIDCDESNLDLGFKVFKLDSSNIKAWNSETENLEEDLLSAVNNIVDGRSEEDILFEIMLKYGLDLTLPVEEIDIAGNKVFNVGMGELICCLSRSISLDTVRGIGKLKEEINPGSCRVVFMDNGFKDDVVKTNAMQILNEYDIEEIRSI